MKENSGLTYFIAYLVGYVVSIVYCWDKNKK